MKTVTCKKKLPVNFHVMLSVVIHPSSGRYKNIHQAQQRKEYGLPYPGQFVVSPPNERSGRRSLYLHKPRNWSVEVVLTKVERVKL